MKFNIIVLSCLFLVSNIFASNIPGAFAIKKPCACGPLEHVFEVNAKNRYAHKYLKPEFLKEYNNYQLSPNVITALQLLSQEVSYRNKDGVLIEPTLNKNGKSIIALGDCEKYKLYKTSLAKSEIKSWLEKVSYDVPSHVIYRDFKSKLGSI